MLWRSPRSQSPSRTFSASREDEISLYAALASVLFLACSPAADTTGRAASSCMEPPLAWSAEVPPTPEAFPLDDGTFMRLDGVIIPAPPQSEEVACLPKPE